MNKWSEEMKGLSTLDVSSAHISDQGAADLSQTLKDNTTLIALYLQRNQIGTKGAKDFFEALKHNKTLEVIDLRDNRIGPKGAKYISEALKINTTLTHINLKGNLTGKAGFKHFEDALAHNFTILVLYIETELPRTYSRSLYTPASLKEHTAVLDSYLKRNNQIADCLRPIKNFDATNLSIDDIEQCIKNLNVICHQWNVSPDEHYIAECQLLLTALKDLNDSKTKEDALGRLTLKFTYPLFQRAADLAFVQFLFKNIFPNLQGVQQHVALSQVLLYKLKQQLHEPALQEAIYSALNLLQFQGKKQTSSELRRLMESTIILNFDTLLQITRGALIKCKRCHPANEKEANLLVCVLKHVDYHPELVTYLLQSPSFVNEFKERFPDKLFFVPVENCLSAEKEYRELARQHSLFFSPSKTDNAENSNSYLISLPAHDLPAVTQEQVQHCKTELCKLNTLCLGNPIRNFEEILANIISCNFFEEWNQDSVWVSVL